MWQLLLVLACLRSTAFAEPVYTTEDDVVVLNDDNFDEIIGHFDAVLVKFYAPWCGHCKALAPEYATAAAKFTDHVRLAKLDATANKKVAEIYEIRGYPTMKLFRKGRPTLSYDGGRSKDDIVQWVQKKTGESLYDLVDAETAKDLLEHDGLTIVGAHLSDEEKTVLETLADDFDDIDFYVTENDELLKVLGVDAKQKVHLLKNFDDHKVAYSGAITVNDLKAWIRAEATPLVTDFTQETAPKIFGNRELPYLLYFASGSSDEWKTNSNSLYEVAKKYKGRVRVVRFDSELDDNERILEFLKVDKKELPAVRIFVLPDNESSKRFKPQVSEVTTKGLQSFLDDYFDGKLVRDYASEVTPDDWDQKPVWVLTGTNFGDVIKKHKHVFVKFYAPWCGHCKQLAPIWEQLAEHYQDRDEIVIAKMDVTVNEHEETDDVTGFPTLRFYNEGKATPYSGKRELEDLKKAVELALGRGDAPTDTPKEEEEHDEL